MTRRRLHLTSPIVLLVGCLALVFMAAGVARLMGSADVYVYEPSSTLGPELSGTSPTSSDAAVGEVAVATTGDLLQSVPPNWSFVGQFDPEASIFPGASAKAGYVVRSAASGLTVQLAEYTVSDHATLSEHFKAFAEWKIGQRTVRLVPVEGGGHRLVMPGTYSVIVMSDGGQNGNGGWKQTEADTLPEDLRLLVQSIRLL